MAVREFVDGWLISQVLGEGAYGEVQLLTHRSTNESVAVKIIDKSTNPNVSDMVRKEVCIHRKLNHPNIIKYFGHRKETDFEYIFMEYASGGELFDRIEPDFGMEEWQAQKYFKQILSGVEYMHTLGIAHRDLKPENLLLDEHDNIKITDFGFATLFRMKGAERLLDKLCGTPPYLAPEVLLKEYYAEPADLWSCGIILVTMLAGELPWDKPTLDCPDYVAWKNRKWHATNPWPKIPMQPLSLIQRLLTPLPSQRCKLNEAKEHRWMRKQFSRSVGFIRPSAPAVSPRPKKHCSDSQTDEVSEESTRVYASQPERRIERNMFEDNALPNIDTDCNLVSFSQPAQFEDLLLSSELHGTQGTGTQNQYQKLVRRMTRFFVDISCDKVLKQLTSVLEDAGWSYKIVGRQITVTSVDKRKMPLTYKLNILDMDGKTLLDFRLSKGCGLEFKRRFLRIKASLGEVVLQGPVTWPIAVATHTVP